MLPFSMGFEDCLITKELYERVISFFSFFRTEPAKTDIVLFPFVKNSKGLLQR